MRQEPVSQYQQSEIKSRQRNAIRPQRAAIMRQPESKIRQEGVNVKNVGPKMTTNFSFIDMPLLAVVR